MSGTVRVQGDVRQDNVCDKYSKSKWSGGRGRRWRCQWCSRWQRCLEEEKRSSNLGDKRMW